MLTSGVGMGSKIGRLGILIALAAVCLLGVMLLTFSYSEVGVFSKIGTEGLPLSTSDLSAVPQSVAEDAIGLATALFGDSGEKSNDFVNQVLAVYSEAKDKDFVVVFNSGGWGWNLLENTPGWWSIFSGIKSELVTSGYKLVSLDYIRTDKSWRGRLGEMGEMITGYQSKAKDLAYRVKFLTSHIPELKVIIAGESNGTVISDRVMTILKDNPQVYSIQTGPPFWHNNITLDRTLVITNNGIIPDSFSEGDFGAIIWGNLKAFLGFSEPIDDFGTILHYVRAPGHDYWWQYPQVYAEITNFLEQKFNIKWW